MVKQRYSTIAAEFASMTDVTDEEICEASRGEVNRMTAEGEDTGDFTGTLREERIFGMIPGDHPDRMGHIELAEPVVNIQYTRGRKATLPAKLRMSLHDLESVIYGSRFILTGEDRAGGTRTYTDKEAAAWKEEHPDASQIFQTETEAIATLLAERGLSETPYILHCIPVMPACMRYIGCPGEGGRPALISLAINRLYEKVITRSERIRRLLALNTLIPPKISINEHRLLQEAADCLISNGLRAFPKTYRAYPISSLDELSNMIMNPAPEKVADLSGLLTLPVEREKLTERWRAYEKSLDWEEPDENQENGPDTEAEAEAEAKIKETSDHVMELMEPVVTWLLQNVFSSYQADPDKLRWLTDQAILGSVSCFMEDRETDEEEKSEQKENKDDPDDREFLLAIARPVYEILRIYFNKQYIWS